jgi:hypothetical protein
MVAAELMLARPVFVLTGVQLMLSRRGKSHQGA